MKKSAPVGFKTNLAKLICIKSITTILMVVTFCYLSIVGKIQPDAFTQVVMIIIGFFFASKTFGSTGHPGNTEADSGGE